MDKNPSSAYEQVSIQVLQRMFVLLDILAEQDEALSLKEISQRADLHLSTAHRI